MDRISILSSKDSALMNEFSRRCIDNLKDHFMFRVFFSVFNDFMDMNVKKETDKDRIIIENSVSYYETGRNIGDIDLETVFEKTIDVDKKFIKKISILPLSIDVRYNEFKEIRKKRIKIISGVVFELLRRWEDSVPFANVVRDVYTEIRFKEVIKEILQLYNLETMKVTNSIMPLYPINIAKDLLAGTLFNVMEYMKEVTTRESVRKIYGGLCHEPT